MICYHCQKAKECSTFRTLRTMSKDFSINDCKDYDSVEKYTYRKIVENDKLMRLIYDYFTGQVEGGYSDEEVREVIASAMWDL